MLSTCSGQLEPPRIRRRRSGTSCKSQLQFMMRISAGRRDVRGQSRFRSSPLKVLSWRQRPESSMHAQDHSTQSLIDLGKRYWVPVYKPRELVLDHGKGARVWDTADKEYVDFGAGIAVNALGHQDADLLAALSAQAQKLWHSSNVFYTEPPLRLAEELVRASHFAERVFLCNSGAEANEAAIKLVRRWAA